MNCRTCFIEQLSRLPRNHVKNYIKMLYSMSLGSLGRYNVRRLDYSRKSKCRDDRREKYFPFPIEYMRILLKYFLSDIYVALS